MRAGSFPEPARSTPLPVFTPSPASDANVQVDMGILRNRKDQFLAVHGSKPSELGKHKVVLNFDKFLKSTSTGAQSWTVATDDNVVDRLCCLDTQGAGITVVHKPACSEFGYKHWDACIQTLGCARPYIVASLEKGW